MKEKITSVLPFLCVVGISYYVFPFIITDTGMGIFVLLFLLPFITLVTSFVCGIMRGFNLFMPLLSAVLFVPSVFIFYNESALVYVLFYGIASIVGLAFGCLFFKK